MVLLALDPATATGWATYEALGSGKPARIRCGVIKAEGDSEPRLFADFSRKMRNLIDEMKPRRVAIEARLPSFAGGDWEDDTGGLVHGRVRRKQIRSEDATKRQDGIRAITFALLGASRPSWGLPGGIPVEEVHVASWRSSFFGKGVKPPQHLDNAGRRKWWKAETRLRANLLGEKHGFVARGDNESDAVGILMWLAARERHLDARDQLKTRAA